MLTNQETVNQHGGFRPGAGRPIGANTGTILSKAELADRLERLQRLGVLQGTARRVLEAMGGDEYFVKVLTMLEAEEDSAKLWGAIAFLLQMRDGRPAQQINVTSQSVTFTPDELIRARGVVRELIAPRLATEVSSEVLTPEVSAAKGVVSTKAIAGASVTESPSEEKA